MIEPSQASRLRVVLVAPRNPLNIGAAARSMSNFGFSSLCVVNPFGIGFREARSAVGASSILSNAAEFANVADAVADCSLVVGTTAVGPRELLHPVHSLPEAAPHIREHLAAGRVALLFGSEKRGLSTDDLSHCHWLLRIPTRDDHRSMNLGQAVAICLYELARDPGAATAFGGADMEAASAQETERLLQVLLEALQASGYLRAGASALATQKLRRLMLRLRLNAGDADLLLGMMRKILWRLQHPETLEDELQPPED